MLFKNSLKEELISKNCLKDVCILDLKTIIIIKKINKINKYLFLFLKSFKLLKIFFFTV
jgi:hypothetical protein